MSPDVTPVAVSFRNVTVRKGRLTILKDLNMTVRRGQIYGLLGPSGCGKTTALNCIIGQERRGLEGGHLEVLGWEQQSLPDGRNRVAYMPQEVALYENMTIAENLRFFGNLCDGLDDVEEFIDFHLDLLDMTPYKDELVGTLSGGQQRRVSIAAALINRDSELVILDEPTVGVDSRLREKVWNHLLELSRAKGKTVIITTHYIEEAKRADVVAFMRQGRILEEGPPEEHLRKHGQRTLEEVFLKLCREDEVNDCDEEELEDRDIFGWRGRREESGVVSPGNGSLVRVISYTALPEEVSFLPHPSATRPTLPSPPQPLTYRPFISLRKVGAIMKKNRTTFLRSEAQLLFSLILPIMEVCIFCLSVGRPLYDHAIAVVNADLPYCDISPYSCELLNHTFNVKDSPLTRLDFPDEASALQAVRAGEAWGMISIAEGFSFEASEMMQTGRMDWSQEMIAAGIPIVRLDQSDFNRVQVVVKALYDGYDRFLRHWLNETGRPAVLADPHLFYGNPILGSGHGTFAHFISPGMMMLIVFFLSMSMGSELLISDASGGQFRRVVVAGVRPAEIILSHVLFQLFIVALQSALVAIFTLGAFSVPCEGSLVWLVGLIMLQGIAGMTYGMFLASVCHNHSMAQYLTIGSFFPNLVLSGVLWPLEGMHWVLQEITWRLPSTAACQAMRDVMSRGWGIEMVYQGYVYSLVWIALFVGASLVVVRIKG